MNSALPGVSGAPTPHRASAASPSFDANQGPAPQPFQSCPRAWSPSAAQIGVFSMKSVSAEEAVAMIPNGATVMVGGFMGVGTPERLLDEMVRQKKSELTIIANDAAVPGRGIGKLFDASLVATITASHIGLNPKVQAQMMEQKISVNLV